ncbi:MAG: BamA/TamA family outer membrane protein [Acidobacteriota bacterium]|nr:BamA/TamA family outer membrane protein [Acidobacteriota bacterium]
MKRATPCRRPVLHSALPGLLLVALSALVTPSPSAAEESPLITSVRVEATGPVDTAGVIGVLELKVGSPVDKQRLRDVITTLYAGAQLEWLRVETTPSPGGVDVLVRLSYRSTISDVKVTTKKPLLRVKIHRWLRLQIGDPVTSAGVEVSRRRVERRLQERGYADVEVEAYLDFNRKSNTVGVEIDVALGGRQVLDSVTLEGLGNEYLVTAAQPKAKTGARLTSKFEERVRTRTEENLRRMGYWEAEVLDVKRRTDGPQVELVLRVDPGSLYRLDLETPPESVKIAEKAFPDPADVEIHPAQTEALAEQVHEHLQEAGFLLAEVDATLSGEGDELVLRVEVHPGAKYKVAAVEFPGADHVSTRQLMTAVRVKTGKTGGRFSQRISDATLEADRKALLDLYYQEGFPFVEIEKTQWISDEDGNAVRVVFPVNEGQQWIVSQVRIEGLPVDAAADLERQPLGLDDRSPWSPGAVDRAQKRLEAALADTGYPDGRVETEVDTSQPGQARVVYRVKPGEFVRVGDVIIAGLLHTREKLVAGVVRRAGVESGAPLSRSRMLEAQRGLYELGMFRRVEVVLMPGHEHRTERNIVIRCDEGEQKSYLFGLGYSNVDAARLILGWSHLNLLGRAYGFSAEVSLSRSQQQYSLSLRKRRIFGLPVPGYLAIYLTDEVLADRDLLRRGLWIDFGDRLKRPLRPWLRYEYEIIQPDNLPPDLIPELDDDLQESKVASITPSIEWDTRDNPLAPEKGVFASGSAQYAFPAFLADEHFLKVQLGATAYKPMWRGFVAVGLRLGFTNPFDKIPDAPENLQIPFAYRFFAGGRTTLRAFDTDELGIPGQTIIDGRPVGGNALILFNLQYRRRIVGDFFAEVFIDAGNVWASPSQVTLGDIRWGPGLGIQYRTPAGPLRAEYAWKLEHQPGESKSRYFVSFGVPF